MKKLLTFIALFLFVTNVFGQMKIERTHCGLTIGKTNFKESMSLIKCSDENWIPFPVCLDKEVSVYRGKFTVDGFDFSIVVAHFFNDTLYQLEFEEICNNADISVIIKTFMEKELKKYSVLKEQFESNANMDSFFVENNLPVPINKTDGYTNIAVLGNDNFVSLKVEDSEMNLRSLGEDLKKMYGSLDANHSEENRVTGVGGLTFGESMETAIQKFEKRGTLIESINNQSSFSDVSVGGVVFDYGILYFSSGNEKKLISVSLQKLYSPYQYNIALQLYEGVCQTYRKKYTNGKELLNKGDGRMSGFGMLSNDYAEGKMYPIGVNLQKSLSKGGSQYYYVTVTYFLENISTIYNDDI